MRYYSFHEAEDENPMKSYVVTLSEAEIVKMFLDKNITAEECVKKFVELNDAWESDIKAWKASQKIHQFSKA